jgi:hypothetical protein
MARPARAIVILLALGAGCAGGDGAVDTDPDIDTDVDTDTDPPDPPTFDDSVFYAGDPHAHTGYSGDGADSSTCPGCGAFADVFATARAAGLSWLALADHVNGYPAATPAGYREELHAVLDADDPDGGFVTLPAAEVWFRSHGHELGHKTLLLFGDDASLAGLTLADVQPVPGGAMDIEACDDIWTWADALEARFGPLLLVPHHPAGVQPMPTDWTCADAARQPVTEVYSEQGSALDDPTGFDPPWAGTVATGTVPYALDPDGLALRFGFIGGTDSHDTLPGGVCAIDEVRTDQPYGGGLTVAVLPAGAVLGRDTLLAAFQDHSVYATTGPIVPLQLTWTAGGAALGGLGADLVLPAGVDLGLTLRVPPEWAPAVTSVEAVGPTARLVATDAGDGTWTLTVPSADVPAWLYLAVALDGDAIYGADGCADGGATATEWAWTSPSWIGR